MWYDKVWKFLTGTFYGGGVVVVAILISVSLFQAIPNFIGFSIAALLIVGSLQVGWQIFQAISNMGSNKFLSAAYAARDMDRIDQGKHVDHNEKAKSFAEAVNTNKVLRVRGRLEIFTHPFELPFAENFRMLKATFKEEEKKLELTFTNKLLVRLIEPEFIYRGKNILKIEKARRIDLMWFESDNKRSFQTYQIIEDRLTFSNSKGEVADMNKLHLQNSAFILFKKIGE